MRAQQEQIGQHKATIDQLFQAQLADPEEIQTSAYIVGDTVLRKLGQSSDGSYSWARIKPLPRHERNFILRTHAGTFAGFPPDLDLVTATKAIKEIQSAKISVVILVVSCAIMYDVECYYSPVPKIRVVIVFIIS
jgi:hypothetical protein